MIPFFNQGDQAAADLPSSEANQSRDARLAYWQRLNEQLNRFNMGLEVATQLHQKQYASAATGFGALISPIQLLNSELISMNSNYKMLGVTIEDVMAKGQFQASMLANNFERMRAAVMSFPKYLKAGLMQGMEMESNYVSAAAGIVRSEFTNSIDEGKQIISEVKNIVRQRSAPLPGDTNLHMMVSTNTIDDSFRLAKEAGKSLDEAKEFAAWVAGQIGSIAGVQGAEQASTLRFANALMSGTLSPRSQLDLVERNPALKSAITDVFKEYGVDQFYQISKDKQMEAMRKLLEKAFPKDQLEASASTLEGAMQSFTTGLKSLKDMTRVLERKYEIEISVYYELRNLAMRILEPAGKVLDKLSQADSPFDPMVYLQKGMSTLYPLLGGTAQPDRQFSRLNAYQANNQLGFFDTLQWIGTQMDQGKSLQETFKSGDFALRFFQNTLLKFQTGWDEAMARFGGFLKYTEIIPTRSLANVVGKIFAEIINAIARAQGSLLPIIKDFMVEFFETVKKNLDVVSIFSAVKEMQSIMALFDRAKGAISTVEKSREIFSMIGKQLVVLSGIIGGAATALMVFTKALNASSAIARAPANINNALVENGLFNTNKELLRLESEYGNIKSMPSEVFARYQSLKDREASLLRDYIDPDSSAAGLKAMLPGPVVETLSALKDWANRQDEAYKKTEAFINNLNPLSHIFPNAQVPDTQKTLIENALGYGSQGLMMYAGFAPLLGAPVEHTVGAGIGAGILTSAQHIYGFLSVKENREQIEKVTQAIGIHKHIKKFLDLLEKIFTEPVGALLALGKAGAMFVAWAGALVAVLVMIYRASPELQSAVKRFINGMLEFFNWISDRLRFLFKPIERILAAIGKVLAFVLNRFSDLFGFTETSSINPDSVSTRLLKQESAAQDERIKKANLAAESSYTGHMANLLDTVGTAAAGRLTNLINAAMTESRNAPAGANLIIANSTETIRTAEQEKALQLQLGASGKSFHIGAVNINIPEGSFMSNDSAEAHANEIARVFINALRVESEK